MEMGRIYADIHREHGIDLRLGTGAERFEGGQRVERVVTSGGESVECDFVVIGVGIDPETAFVEGTEIKVEDGITVDEFCQTNVEGIFAAGDVASWARRRRGWRPGAGPSPGSTNGGARATEGEGSAGPAGEAPLAACKKLLGNH